MAITNKKNNLLKNSLVPTSIIIEVSNHNGNIVEYIYCNSGIIYIHTIQYLKDKYGEKYFIKSYTK